MAHIVVAEYALLARQSQDPLHRKWTGAGQIVEASDNNLYDENDLRDWENVSGHQDGRNLPPVTEIVTVSLPPEAAEHARIAAIPEPERGETIRLLRCLRANAMREDWQSRGDIMPILQAAGWRSTFSWVSVEL